MQVTVFGATGQVGKRLLSGALAEGYTVKAFARNTSTLIDADLANEKLIAIKGYVFNKADVKTAIQGSEWILSALGGASDGSDKTRSLGIKTIVDSVAELGITPRIINVVNTGIMPASSGNKLMMDEEDFPREYLPVTEEHKKAFEILEASGLEFISVAASDLHDEEANNSYDTWRIPPGRNLRTGTGNLAAYMLKLVRETNLPGNLIGISDRL